MSEQAETRKLTEIVYRERLYPRMETDPVAVQRYAETIELLPPIEINQHNELIDGWHRWTAHKKQGQPDIRVTVTQTSGDAELLELAIERNATHGLQLSQSDKQAICRRIYAATSDKERDGKKKHLAHILSVPDRTIRDWLSKIDRDAKEERKARIFGLWMSCHTQEEIAAMEGLPQSVVSDMMKDFIDFGKIAETDKVQANHLADFTHPIYNIWRPQEKSTALNHHGNSEIRLVDNLLYLYTQPFDIVVDPFGGSGSTIDLCKKRLRRYWVGDRKPIPERERDIRQHDVVTDGIPRLPRWKDVKLVYLDPPYWKQAEGAYSKDPTDFGNMPLADFNTHLASVITQFAEKLNGACIALIIQPTQWNAPEHQYTDHVGDMLRAVDLPVDMRYSAPYSTEQHNAQMVDWAKANKKCLVLTREIIVWRTTP